MLTIKDLIQHARREIEAAATERIAKEQNPLLAVESVVIEVNVVVTESKEGAGGFDLKVITASGKKSYEQQQVQKITVVLKTIDEPLRALRFGSPTAASIGERRKDARGVPPPENPVI